MWNDDASDLDGHPLIHIDATDAEASKPRRKRARRSDEPPSTEVASAAAASVHQFDAQGPLRPSSLPREVVFSRASEATASASTVHTYIDDQGRTISSV
jgi:hypothetical protein